MLAYYNEFDASAAAWLRELINRGLIAPGIVDTRDIRDVKPSELKAYRQCHFFAGIGGWSHALRLAGWADHRPVWTGSCPCQPFSAAGRGAGVADERHLWPHWNHLIRECRPAIVFGEQVASKDGLGWLDLVSADLERSGYAVGAADLCAAGVGAHHIRQRLYFVGLADADGQGSQGWVSGRPDAGRQDQSGHGGRGGATGRVEYDGRLEWWAKPSGRGATSGCGDQRLADAESDRDTGAAGQHAGSEHFIPVARRLGGAESMARGWTSTPDGPWRDADWLFCRDGKWRAVKSGTFPLADGLPARVGRLRGYGNAIVPQVAQAFIEAVMG